MSISEIIRGTIEAPRGIQTRILQLSQRPEEPFSEFCARIGETLKERGFSGAYLISDRVNMYEPIGVIVAG